MAIKLAACNSCGEVHPEEVLKCPREDVVLDLAGRLLDGRFRLLQRLGAGGMATVWRARNVRVDRTVAIKLIRHDLTKTAETLARFRDEARAAGRIENPHICEILDLGTSPIGPYMVMELLAGMSLGELIKQEERLAPDVAVAIARHALEGLAAAHDAGIVHRDLTPGNVFIHQPVGKPPLVKLMDFGVSKFLHGGAESETAHGALLGTPEYMSPEQVSGAKDVDERTDIWAMGAILYRAISGQDAFQGPTVGARLVAVSLDEPTSLAELAADTPDGLVQVIRRCLSRDVAERYPTARALSEALEPFGLPGPLPVLKIEPPEWTDEDSDTIALDEPEAATVLYQRGGDERGRQIRLVAAAVVGAAVLGLGGWLASRDEEPPVQPEPVPVDARPPVEGSVDAPETRQPKKKRRRGGRPSARTSSAEPLPSLDDESWEGTGPVADEGDDEPAPERLPGLRPGDDDPVPERPAPAEQDGPAEAAPEEPGEEQAP